MPVLDHGHARWELTMELARKMQKSPSMTPHAPLPLSTPHPSDRSSRYHY